MSLYHRLLVPIVECSCMDMIIQSAIRLASDENAQLHFITIQPRPAEDYEGEGRSREEDAIMNRDIQHRQSGILDQAQSSAHASDLHAETTLIEYNDEDNRSIADHILDVAQHWEADLIIMGPHAQPTLERLLLGSTTQAVLRKGTIPVLVIQSATDMDN